MPLWKRALAGAALFGVLVPSALVGGCAVVRQSADGGTPVETGGAGSGGAGGAGGAGGQPPFPTGFGGHPTGEGGAGGSFGGSGGDGAGGSGGAPDVGDGGGGDGLLDASGEVGDGGAGDAAREGGTVISSPAHIQYRCTDTATMTTSLALRFAIRSVGVGTIDLAKLTIRYWYTSDVPQTVQTVRCENVVPSQVVPCTKVLTTLHPVVPARALADSYIEIAFTPDAGSIGFMGAISQLDVRFEAMFPGHTQTNDYSFGPTITNYADYMKVTAYVDGSLVWGTEPP